MNTKSKLLTLLIALSLPLTALAGGDKEGNGGDACILGLKSVTYLLRDAIWRLPNLKDSGVRVGTLSELMGAVQFATEEKTVLRGADVDAINYPE